MEKPLNLKRWKELIEKVPERSGVYLFKRGKDYIYIGKAKY